MLEALFRHTYQGRVEILIVDNGSKNPEGQRLKEGFGELITVRQHEKNEGFAEGNNLAIKQLLQDEDVEAIVLLNNDTIPNPNFLTELINTWQEEKSDLVGACMKSMDNPREIDNVGIVLTAGLLPFDRRDWSLPLFCPSGGCVLYSKIFIESMMEEYGYFFDPRFFAYCEDLDIGFRALAHDFKSTISKKAVVLHKGSAATSPMSDFAVQHTYRNLIWAISKNLPFFTFMRRLPKILIAHLGIITYHTIRGKWRIIFRAYLDGVRGSPKFLKEKISKVSYKKISKVVYRKIFIFS